MASFPGDLLGSLAEIWGEQFPRSAAKLPGMVGAGPIALPTLMNGRWIAPAGPSPASWPSILPCANWLPETVGPVVTTADRRVAEGPVSWRPLYERIT